jgi:hypothetical protein
MFKFELSQHVSVKTEFGVLVGEISRRMESEHGIEYHVNGSMPMATQIFNYYAELLTREDKIINGVSPAFAETNPEWAEMNADNVGCWDCRYCDRCSFCTHCSHCVECYHNTVCNFSYRSTYCKDCETCLDCEACHGCTGCVDCQDCRGCKRCEGCTDCEDCIDCSGLTGARGLRGVHK